MIVNPALQPVEINAATHNVSATNASPEQTASFGSLLFLTLQLPQGTNGPVIATEVAPQPPSGLTAPLSDLIDGSAWAPGEPESIDQRNEPPTPADDTSPPTILIGVALGMIPSPLVPTVNQSSESATVDVVGALAAGGTAAPAEALQAAAIGNFTPSEKGVESDAPLDQRPPSAEPQASDDRQLRSEKNSFQALAAATIPAQGADAVQPPIGGVDGQEPPRLVQLSLDKSFQTVAPETSTAQVGAAIEQTTGFVDGHEALAPLNVTPDRTHATDSPAQLSAAPFEKHESAASAALTVATVPTYTGHLQPGVSSRIHFDADGGGELGRVSQSQNGNEANPTAVDAPNPLTEIHTSGSNQGEQGPNFFAGERNAAPHGADAERHEADQQLLPNLVAGVPTARGNDSADGGEAAALPWRPVIDRLAGDIASHVRIGSQEAVIQLDPPELGKIKIDLRMEDGKLHARIAADSLESRALIESHLGELRQALSVGRVEVAEMQVTQSSWNSGGDLTQGYQQSAQGRQRNSGTADRGGSPSAKGVEERARATETRASGRVSMWA